MNIKLNAQRMAVVKTALTHNIKYLRKKMAISQEELATLLNIKRSNIAAYESKNVEPRLRIILELAKIFDVDVSMLITEKIGPETELKSFGEKVADRQIETINLGDINQIRVEKFIDKSSKIRKILEGFKSFYAFRKRGIKIDSPEKERVIFDIDNFIQLMDHLLTYNENVIGALSEISSRGAKQ